MSSKSLQRSVTFNADVAAARQIPCIAENHETITPKAVRHVPKRLQNFLDRATAAGLLDHKAVQAVLNLCDPFPDDAVKPVGWPSLGGSNTVPLALTDFLTIGAPAGATKNWHMKTMFLPFNGTYNTLQYNDYNGGAGTVGAATASAASYGQFNVWTWKDDDPEPDWITTPPTQSITLDPGSSWSLVRILAAGFELINTSADLYRGGMYYAWRSPLYSEAVNLQSNPLIAATTINRCTLMAGLPASLSKVINLNTTVQGQARNGVGVFSLPENELNRYEITLPTQLFLTQLSAGTTKMRIPSSALTNLYRWQPCGAYVTGLALQATFQERARIYYECEPDPASTNFMQSIAHAPTPQSFISMELLSKVISEMPCGFDYSENPFGEWFARVLGALAGIVPSIGAMIPHPAAAPIAMAAGPLLKAISHAVEQSNNKKQKQKPPNATGQKKSGQALLQSPKRKGPKIVVLPD